MSDTGVFLTRGAEGLDRRGFTITDIERMIEAGILDPDEKFELIDGEIVPMSPQAMPHMLMRTRIANWLTAAASPPILVVAEATLLLADRRFYETDVLAFEHDLKSRYVRPQMVKLAVEVADTSRARDLDTKAPGYGAAGVPELWVVELNERCTYVFRGPGTSAWTGPLKIAFADALSPLFMPGVELRIADLDVQSVGP